ncbi:Tyrosine recombinase XerC [Maioricimonas rarisocia]|uniref:Tyrosine recombinase XerC n=1 Tax=Maioricimonas rarisocia TaxID=2528026 RepID=A0A517Z5C9_9PLAN|nr:tyrosine-type recombinase/integrase [Maioricimonas rarisocia]QDU37663.1 Tyrosine recombinase XerC [Maioricimonas rarisocia]
MANSTAQAKRTKPERPEGFPLFPHANGQWARKKHGKFYYYGPWDDPEAALKRLEDEEAGRSHDHLTLKELFDRFLTAKHSRVVSGELTLPTYRDYLTVLQHVASFFGKHRPADELTADDFRQLRDSFARSHGPVRLQKDIVVTRMPFRWAYESGLLEHSVRFGPDFKPPSRRARLKATRAYGRKDFSAKEIKAILAAASQPLRAMILLGINAGLGQSDIANLQRRHVDLQAGWLEYPRPKTEIERRCPLWPETVAALQESLQTRPKPKGDADADCVFLTSHGRRYLRMTEKSRTDTITPSFRRLLNSLGIKDRRNFYSLRHTFETQAGESRDQVAVDLIMGHADHSMAANYRHRISDDRLRDVVAVVRTWLWPDTRKPATPPEGDDQNM